MKRKRQARILLGILLAALLLLPGGMRIKAEEVVSGDQSTQEVQGVVEGSENVVPTDPGITNPPPEDDEETLPLETKTEEKKEEQAVEGEPTDVDPEEEEPTEGEPANVEPANVEPAAEGEPTDDEKAAEVDKSADVVQDKVTEVQAPVMRSKSAPPVTFGDVESGENNLTEKDLKAFGCDFIWGINFGDKLFDFKWDYDLGSKIGWFDIDHILCKDKIFDPGIEFKCITFEKIWENDESKDRPHYVMFDLYVDKIKVATLPIVSNGTNNWKTKILLPVKVHKKVINYTIDEHDIEGYDSDVDGFKIINTKTIIPKMRDFTVKKVWKESDNVLKPASVEFWLTDGEKKIGDIRTITSKDGWEVTFKVAVFDENGKEINYEIEEVDVQGYDSEVIPGCENGNHSAGTLSMEMDCCEPEDKCPDFTIINTFNNKREITLEKVWDDENYEGRPDEVIFTLYQNDKELKDITITKANGWKETLTVALNDGEGDVFDYEISEKVVPEGYEDEVNGFTITNTLIVPPEKIEIKGEKTWIDLEGDVRPEFINVKLMGDGKLIETKKVEPVDGKWMYEFVDLPKYDGENIIKYEVVEDPVEGYRRVEGTGFNIVNEKIIKIIGEKTWLDDGTGRPDFIKVKLMADGELLETKKVEGNWMYDFGMLPKYNEEMEEIDYSVSEEPVDGYEFIPGEDFDITNKRIGKIIVSGEKTWDDLMNRPASITVYLERDGESIEEVEVKANEMGKWLYTFKETDKYNEEGMPYTYTVSEKSIIGYDVEVTDFDIHNIQQRGTLKVLKVNEAGKPLAGAVFEVRDISGKVLKTFTTGADGLFSMELPLGMYRLVEVSPPPGYAKNTVPRLVVLFRKGAVQTLEIENSVDKSPFVPTPIPTYPQLPDTGGKVLPSTGAGSEMGFYFLGLASVAAGLLTMKKKKN